MNTTITATNPTELRQEAERLLRQGLPMAPAVLAAITGTDPDVGYELTCQTPACSPLHTDTPCRPAQTHAGRIAAFALDGWEQFWVRHGSTGVLARAWDPADVLGVQPLAEWEADTTIAAAQSIGFDLTQGEHTSRRRQAFWLSGPCVVVITDTPEHGEVIHTIEQIMPTAR